MTSAISKPSPDYTEEELQALIGKHILVGITHCDIEGKATSQEEFHGIICRVSYREGVAIKLNDSNAERTIPPDFSCMELARPGEYKLTGTGEVVEDPDYIATLNIYPKGYKG